MNKIYIFLGLILLLAAVFRLTLLNNVPNSITYDQIYYILNAKSFLSTGTDLSGTINPLQPFLFHYPTGGLAQSEFPFFLQFLLLSFLPMSLTTVILPNALISILTVFLFFLIGTKLFDKKTGLYISLIAAINPWFIFMGRTFYEMVPATFFYLCFFYVLLIAKKWKILFAFPLFLLAFYSYIGTKLIALPFLLLSIAYCYFFVHKKQYAKQYLTLILLAIITTLFFFFQLMQHPESSRLNEIISPNNPAIIAQVNNIRKLSIHNPLTNLFENKVTIYIKILIDNFFNIFSPSYLFAHGDTFFSIYKHGLFYIIDLVFLAIGAVWLFAHKNKLFLFFISCIVLSTVPQIIHDPEGGGNFTPHITLLFPFFIMMIGVGIAKATAIRNKNQRIGSILLIGFLYTLSLFNFLNIYFYQFPLQTGVFDFSARILSHYITLAKKPNQAVTVYTNTSDILFKKYLFYSNSYTKQSASDINQSLREGKIAYNNVRFISCPDTINEINKSDLIIMDTGCKKVPRGKSLSIAQLKDSGNTYHIINDRTCKQYNLNHYIAWLKLQDLAVEKLNAKKFCETFIIY